MLRHGRPVRGCATFTTPCRMPVSGEGPSECPLHPAVNLLARQWDMGVALLSARLVLGLDRHAASHAKMQPQKAAPCGEEQASVA